jgi:hypothetical protein
MQGYVIATRYPFPENVKMKLLMFEAYGGEDSHVIKLPKRWGWPTRCACACMWASSGKKCVILVSYTITPHLTC